MDFGKSLLDNLLGIEKKKPKKEEIKEELNEYAMNIFLD